MATPEASSSKTLTASCLCKSIQFTLAIPTSQLPLDAHLCHCDRCRYTHGTLCTFHATLPPGIVPEFISPSSLSNLTSYLSGDQAKSIIYFCSTCGCQIGDELRGCTIPQWTISTAIFDANRDDHIWKLRRHIYAESVSGRGLVEWLPRINDREMEVFKTEAHGETLQERHEVNTVRKNDQEWDDGKLRAECHCGGVSFTISRPTEAARQDPDSKNTVSPLDPNKWLALLDLCDSCRLIGGTNIVAWTFPSLDSISPRLPEDLIIGTSKAYESSEGIRRTFCGTCGANILYSCSDRPAFIDVAVGILRAPEGVTADNWVTWRTHKIGYQEDGDKYDQSFAKAVREGHEAWGKEKYGS